MRKYFLTKDLNYYVKIYTLLGYQEVQRKPTLSKSVTRVTFRKDKEIDNFAYLKARYAPKTVIPFFFVILFIVLAVALATTFLVISIVNKDADRLFYFCVLMLPTFLCTLLATGISFQRYLAELKNIERIAAIPLLEKEVMNNENKR